MRRSIKVIQAENDIKGEEEEEEGEDCLSLQLTNAMQIEVVLSNVNTPKGFRA